MDGGIDSGKNWFVKSPFTATQNTETSSRATVTQENVSTGKHPGKLK